MSSWFVVLTGGIGSGKSLAAGFFKARGITIVEQDDVSREIVEPGEPALDRIIERFGEAMLNKDGTLNRQAMRERIFANADDKLWLERLTHPLIGQRTMMHMHTAASRYAIVVNPLLRTRQPQYDRFVVVDVPVHTQIERAMTRDKMTKELATKMVASQTDRDLRRRLADDIINNEGSIQAVEAQVDRLHRRYLVMAC
ncbi:MAG: dephospho-CoA kinase [Gammaproteobacteria bacterium]|nr:dephospho-CoA kinase [Gammaproteobacteria bacterium]